MAFTFRDLIKAKNLRENHLVRPMMTKINLNNPCHGILDHRRNRLITLARYKETVIKLTDLDNLQPFFNINQSYKVGANFDDILDENSELPYSLIIQSDNPGIRWVSEKRLTIYDVVKTDNDSTWKDPLSMSMDAVIEIRLKAAVLDYIYESLNWIRDKFKDDILLNEYIYNVRYQQANDYLQGKNTDFHLLEIYADEIGKDMNTAANHYIFCYEENLLIISKTEKSKKIYENNILKAQSFKELYEICKTWNNEFQGQI